MKKKLLFILCMIGVCISLFGCGPNNMRPDASDEGIHWDAIPEEDNNIALV